MPACAWRETGNLWEMRKRVVERKKRGREGAGQTRRIEVRCGRITETRVENRRKGNEEIDKVVGSGMDVIVKSP